MTDLAHTCPICDRSMTVRRLDVTTFGGDAAYIETGDYECLPCDRRRLLDEIDRARSETLLWRSTAGVLAEALLRPDPDTDTTSTALRRYFDLVMAQNRAVEDES